MSSAVRTSPAPNAPLAPGPERSAGRSRWTVSPDFAVLAAYLVLDLLFGRPFAKLGLGERALYVTEPFLVVMAGLALWRVGWRGAVERVRRALPLWLLGLLWLAGAIATARGLISFGFKRTSYDVGLLEYSVMLALVPVIVDTRDKVFALLRVVAVAGVGAGLVYVMLRMTDATWTNVGPGLGMFIAGGAVYVAARAAHARRVPWWGWLAFLFCLTAMSYAGVRAVWAGMLAMIVFAVAFAPRRRLVVAVAGALAFTLSNVGVHALNRVHDALHGDAGVSTAASAPIADPGFADDDKLSHFTGGQLVAGGAHDGRWSRALGTGELLDLPALSGLQVGTSYTVRFWVRSAGRGEVVGRVGNTGGGGWSAVSWKLPPRSAGWRPVARVLRATASDERLVVIVDKGRARIDDLRVIKGDVAATAAPAPEDPTTIASTEPEPAPDGGLFSQVQGTFTNVDGDPSYENTQWRLDIWRFMLKRVAKQPFFGAGFGRPTNFRWREGLGGLYDSRTGAPSMQDVTGPHNSFVNIIFRTGLSGLVPLLIILVLAGARALAALRARTDTDARAATFMVVLLFVNAGVNAALSVALEGPHMGVYFWTLLALLLVMPRVLGSGDAPAAGRAEA